MRLDRNPLLPTHEHRLTTGLTVLPQPVTFTQADALHDHPWGPLTGTPSRQPGMGGRCPTVTGWGGAQSARCGGITGQRSRRHQRPAARFGCLHADQHDGQPVRFPLEASGCLAHPSMVLVPLLRPHNPPARRGSSVLTVVTHSGRGERS